MSPRDLISLDPVSKVAWVRPEHLRLLGGLSALRDVVVCEVTPGEDEVQPALLVLRQLGGHREGEGKDQGLLEVEVYHQLTHQHSGDLLERQQSTGSGLNSRRTEKLCMLMLKDTLMVMSLLWWCMMSTLMPIARYRAKALECLRASLGCTGPGGPLWRRLRRSAGIA